jgi:hypothetical protein
VTTFVLSTKADTIKNISSSNSIFYGSFSIAYKGIKAFSITLRNMGKYYSISGNDLNIFHALFIYNYLSF